MLFFMTQCARADFTKWLHRAMIFLAIILIAACGQKGPEHMAQIPAGSFMMGTDQYDEDELALDLGFPQPWYVSSQPLHRVTLPAYYLDIYEVTNSQYREFLIATDHQPPMHWQGTDYLEHQENTPVSNVNWFDAAAYCKWVGKRLPSEAEWEKAARSTDGRLYPWGNEFDSDRANVAGLHGGLFTEVGSFESGKSPYGVYDMVGNVTEWTSDWYQPYPGNTRPPDPGYGKINRTIRGSSKTGLGHFPPGIIDKLMRYYSLSFWREFAPPAKAFPDVGFRCAKSY